MISLGQLSAIIACVAVVPYVYEIYRKGVRPERASWFIWTILLTISFFAQRAAGAQDSLWLTFGDAVGTAAIFVISLFKGTGGFTRFDIKCMAIAAVGVTVWVLSGNAVVAILGSLLADTMGSVPTIRKAYKDPASEGWTTFLLIAIASTLAVFAAGTWELSIVIVPLYLVAANVAVLIARQLGFKKQKHEPS